MKTAFIFPGQGVQSRGMGKDLYEACPSIRGRFDMDPCLASICFEEDNDELFRTDWAQKAILALSCSIADVLVQHGLQPDICCGLSLGEYSALVAAGRLSYQQALPLVARRGKLMADAFYAQRHGMMAVLDERREQILEVCAQMQQEGRELWPANFNSPAQTVLSGSLEDLAEAKSRLRNQGIARCRMLKTAGAFHSPLLEEAGRKLRKALDQTVFEEDGLPVVLNVTGRVCRPKESLPELLQQQICHPVQFEASMNTLKEQGVERAVLIGPGRSLTGIVKACLPDVQILEVSGLEDIESLFREGVLHA